MTDDPARALYKKRAHEAGADTDVDNLAAWSFGLGLTGFSLLWYPLANLLAIPLGASAIALGIASNGRIRRDARLRGRGFAVAAVVLGVLDILIVLLSVVLFGVLFWV